MLLLFRMCGSIFKPNTGDSYIEGSDTEGSYIEGSYIEGSYIEGLIK